MEDLETLRVIKDKEQSINYEVELIKKEKEKELQQLESSFSVRLKENEERLTIEAARKLEDVEKKSRATADRLLISSREKADRIRMKIEDSQIEEVARKTFNQYLEGM